VTEYTFSENSKAITHASARAHTYTQQRTIKTSYIRLSRNTEVDPNFDNIVKFFEILFSFFSFLDHENTSTPSIRNVGSNLPADTALHFKRIES